MITSWPWQLLNWLFTHAVNKTPSFWLIVAAGAVVVLVGSWRLGRFTAPTAPLLSESVRDVNKYLIFWPTLVLTAATLCLWVALLGLAWYLDAPDPAWLEITSRATRMLTGAASGLISAMPIHYLLIPSIEKPKATLATPDARVKAQKPFDPEPFFKVGQSQ